MVLVEGALGEDIFKIFDFLEEVDGDTISSSTVKVALTSREKQGERLVPIVVLCHSYTQIPWDGDWVDVETLETLGEPGGSVLCEALALFWPVFPHSDLSLYKLFSFHSELRNVCELTFYGGAFNPFHLGHLTCIQSCPTTPLIIIPDHNPQKVSLSEEEGFSSWRVYKNLVREVKRLGKGYYVYPGFCGKQNPNPTIDWLQLILGRKNLLLGDDCFLDILNWKRSSDLLGYLHEIYVVPRSLEKPVSFEGHVKKVQIFNPSLKCKRLAYHQYEDLSSTQLRQQRGAMLRCEKRG